MRQSGEAPAELNDEEQQLAAMYVDGVCPKCGRVRARDRNCLALWPVACLMQQG